MPAAIGGVPDINTALQEVMKKSLAHDGVVRGLHEATKALDKYVVEGPRYWTVVGIGTRCTNLVGRLSRRQALLCVLAENCSEAMYKKLVQGLCNEHQIPLLTVDDNKKLGEWAGLCKIDNSGKARKVVGCSCVVIRVSI